MPNVTVKTEAVVSAKVSVTDAENIMKQYTLSEGDTVTNLQYTNGYGDTYVVNEGIIDAILFTRAGYTASQSPILDGRPTNPQDNDMICPITAMAKFRIALTEMIIDVSEKNTSKHVQIPFKNIISIGAITPATTEVTADSLPEGGLNTVITDAADGATVSLAEGTYTMAEALTIDKSIEIVGPNDVPQKPRTKAATAVIATLSEDSAVSDIPGAVMDGAITINNADADVTFRGMSFTGNFLPKITAARSVSFINCRFEDIIANEAKTMLITCDANSACKLVIDGCYFGTPAASSTGAMYHITEPNGTMQPGSYFSNNYFDLNCTTHNKLNFYKAVDGINITVSNNYDAKSASMMRLGFQGAIKATVNVTGNTYDDTDVEQWAGLVGMQPYNKVTTDMSNWTVNIDGNTNNSQFEQITYMYFGANDMPLDETKMPKVFVDGVAYDVPIISDQAASSTATETTAQS